MITEIIHGQWLELMIAGISATVSLALCLGMAVNVYDSYHQS
jgi:hypothetical protein